MSEKPAFKAIRTFRPGSVVQYGVVVMLEDGSGSYHWNNVDERETDRLVEAANDCETLAEVEQVMGRPADAKNDFGPYEVH